MAAWRPAPLAALLFAGLLAGCGTAAEDSFGEPPLSAVGSGLYDYPPVPLQNATFQASGPRTKNSLWSDDQADFYKDPRALSTGDIVTVSINIDDAAKLDSSSKRSRTAGISAGADLSGSLGSFVLPTVGATLGLDSGSESDGEGTVKRSEAIDLSVAAVVGQELPNGNLFISGQQEVRVNNEIRVLSIAGLIRPRDIGANNTIPYDKIAEARISYAGRGRISEVQKPGWGQQVYDRVAPY